MRAVAVDGDDRLVLLRANDAGTSAVLELLTLDGEVDERHDVELPPGFGPASAVVAARQLAVVGAGGLAVLDPSITSTSRRVSTFMTPTLRSPVRQDRPGGRRGRALGGWNRAEVEVTLPRGTTVELAWAATDEMSIVQDVDAILADARLAPRARLAALDSLLTWRTEDRVVYESATDPAGGTVAVPERLAASIDRPEQHLWVRVTVTTAIGAEPPTVAGLHVSYPSMSFVDDLPAVYREDATSASQLRRLLAPFEVLFDGLDARIDSLPARIDPGTADDEWTSVLLGWLGLPPLEDLAPDRRRTLLRELPQLQEARGTQWALVRALEIVTGRPVRVRDHSGEPAWWFLPRTGRPAGVRLGIDTVVAGSQPAAVPRRHRGGRCHPARRGVRRPRHVCSTSAPGSWRSASSCRPTSAPRCDRSSTASSRCSPPPTVVSSSTTDPARVPRAPERSASTFASPSRPRTDRTPASTATSTGSSARAPSSARGRFPRRPPASPSSTTRRSAAPRPT